MDDYYNTRRLGLILSVQAEIEGMKAENVICQQKNIPLKYGYEDFKDKSRELENWVYAHNEQL